MAVAQADEDVVVRTWVITALGALGDIRAVEPLVGLLDDKSSFIRQAAVKALGVIGHPAAIEPLRRAAARERWYSRGTHRKAIRSIRAHGSA